MFKPPICLGFFCDELSEELYRKYGKDGDRFASLMRIFAYSDLIHDGETEKLFVYMDTSIEAGKKLLLCKTIKLFNSKVLYNL